MLELNQYKNLGKGALADMLARGISHEKIKQMAKVQPEYLAHVLQEHGWEESSTAKENVHVWQKFEQRKYQQVSVPFDKADADYEESMISAVYAVYLHDGISLDTLLKQAV